MKWMLVISIGIGMASCSSDKNNEKVWDEFRHEGKVMLCECVFADTSGFVNKDSCMKQTMEQLDQKRTSDKRFAALADTIEFEIYFDHAEMEKVCPGWNELMARKLRESATKMAQDKSYLSADNEFAGTLLSWKKLSSGEGEYELVMKSIKDSTTHTFITQAKPPGGDEPAIIYITFEPNEAAYHEKYPYRVVQIRFTSKK